MSRRKRGLFMRRLATVGSIAILATLAVGEVRAQSPLWRVVQGGDGTLYLLTGGLRFTLQPDPVSDEDLALIPDGGTIVGAVAPPAPPAVPGAGGPPNGPAPATVATPAPSSGPAVGTRENPVPLGTAATLAGGWRLIVQSVEPNATSTVLAQNPARRGPAADHQFFMARIQVTNLGVEPQSFQAGSRLRAVGSSSVPYLLFVNACGALPDPFPEAAVTPGASVAGNICWAVRAQEAAALVLFDLPPAASADTTRLYLALHQ